MVFGVEGTCIYTPSQGTKQDLCGIDFAPFLAFLWTYYHMSHLKPWPNKINQDIWVSSYTSPTSDLATWEGFPTCLYGRISS